MRGRRLPIACIGALVLLAALRVAAVWDAMPEHMASHFGRSGQPDGWQSKTAFFVTFGAIGLFTLVTLLLPAWFLRFIPAQMINIPYRDYWLTPERRPEAMDRLAGFMDWFSVMLTVVLVATLELVLRANMGQAPLNNTVMLAMLAAFFAFTIVWLIRMWRNFKPPELR